MYFLDTYAMIEYLRGNRKAEKIIENGDFCTSDYQLMELYYISLREQGENRAEEYFEAFAIAKVSIPERTLKNAMKMRLEFQNKGKNISYVDAIGYAYSLENGMEFVTGDAAFAGLGNVENISR
ncbi:PIN domain-containing protein [Candidatus Micrarchaeota archaeon]|nr:PIN domain-containing protein [Candidatus Micrarchaeota archaeon]